MPLFNTVTKIQLRKKKVLIYLFCIPLQKNNILFYEEIKILIIKKFIQKMLFTIWKRVNTKDQIYIFII